MIPLQKKKVWRKWSHCFTIKIEAILKLPAIKYLVENYNLAELQLAEENILEEIEYLEHTEGYSIECISIENLEGILTEFFSRKITLKNKK